MKLAGLGIYKTFLNLPLGSLVQSLEHAPLKVVHRFLSKVSN